ncbi:DUF1643 domain-containing protein [Herbiconiux sp. CPCC 205716]|uniref:DUF1643 domain-containing protein n=1 Tax=Herbiconiux gentiana TaxID=2970912 RepID=A0ABT2GJR5_9MICO|nr:DUF1643 domain-containing protein [Herbiconiux gentiana]MCS5716471.1 DUF1643 domain-containing protein [Herbiconiux gentiana]
MLNVYAQRATKPSGIHRNFDPLLKAENERQISDVINGKSQTVWAAWGSIIEERKFLRVLLKDILDLPALAASEWVSRGPVSAVGHPHHPLYVKAAEPLKPFSTAHYR